MENTQANLKGRVRSCAAFKEVPVKTAHGGRAKRCSRYS